MGDNDYENIDGWRPILIGGVRNPYTSWWEHRQRGSLGGVDCVAQEGTPIHAPANCYITNIGVEAGGSGGRTTTATYNDGWKDQFMHLQKQVPTGSYQKGMTIGWTGMSVASDYPRVDQHLHWHRIDPNGFYVDPYGRTNRRNPWDYFTGSGTSGGGTTPIGFWMALTDAQQTQLYNDVIWIRQLIQVTGQPFSWAAANSNKLDDIGRRLAAYSGTQLLGYDWLPAVNNKVDSANSSIAALNTKMDAIIARLDAMGK